MSDLVVRPPTLADEERWRALWAGYIGFYRGSVSEEQTARLWQILLAGEGPFHGLLAEKAGAVVGLVHYLYHDSTWSTQKICYLQDLYVDPNARGAGAARPLMDAVIAAAREAGAFRVYWQTQEFNAPARSLYDTIVPRSSFIVYRVNL